MTIIGYHYSNDEFSPGKVLGSKYDHFRFLDASQKLAEETIRNGHPDGFAIRSGALYIWRDLEWARSAYSHSKKQFLYEVDVEPEDILHQADLCHFTDARDAINSGMPTEEFVRRYWASESHRPEHTKPRFEILTKRIKFKSLIEQTEDQN